MSVVMGRAPYLPFMEPRTAHAPGLMPLPEDRWIVRHLDHRAQMEERRALIAGRPEVVLGLLPEGEAPAEELRDAVFAFLGDEAAGGEGEADPLRAIGHASADDFCLLTPDPVSGEYRLVAGVLCFPSRWLLSEKLGRPLTAIHEPVPDYDGRLARRVNRVFETLSAGRMLWRVNWLVHAEPRLHLPMSETAKAAKTYAPGGAIYLRTERQTLRRLPKTGAVAFGIKTTISPIDSLEPLQAAHLARELATLDPDTISYRSGADLHGAAIRRLAALAGVGAPQSSEAS